VVEGSDICSKCAAKEEKFAEDPSPKCDWIGRVTEEPPGWCRMLGTAWALGKPPVFLGATPSAPASEGEAEEAVSSSSSSSAPAAPTTKKAAAAAAKALKDAEKAATKAAKEKEAAEKKAAKEAKKAAPKAKKEPKASGGAGAPPPPAAAAEEEAEEVEGSLKLIDGTLYTIKDGNVYEYDEMAEKTGDFVGRLKADGESIDTEAEEKGAEEEEEE
jgi:hypothetical protein